MTEHSSGGCICGMLGGEEVLLVRKELNQNVPTGKSIDDACSWKARVRREYHLEIGRYLTKESTKRVERGSLWDADIEKEAQEPNVFVLLCFLNAIWHFKLCIYKTLLKIIK